MAFCWRADDGPFIYSGIWILNLIKKKRYQRGTCIKGLFWPPLEPKTESFFSLISYYWFIRRIAQVHNSGIYFNLLVPMVTKMADNIGFK